MKKITLLLSLLLCTLHLFSQYQVGGTGGVTDRAREIQTKSKVNNFSQNKMNKTKLNFFLDDEWQGGVMFENDSVSVNGFSYRYNIYTDQIELRSLVNPSVIKMISIGTKKFIYSGFIDIDDSQDEGYFELVADGECMLLLRREIEFKQASGDIEAYGSNASTSIEERLFIKKGNEPAVELVKSKDFLKNYLSDKEKAVDYLNKKVILFFTDKKVIEIIEYYNKI